MNRYLDLSIRELHELLVSGKVKPKDLVLEAIDRIENSDLNAFITVCKDEALKRAEELENADKSSMLYGIPIAIKDNINTKGIRTTCASHMLENFVPFEDAFVIDKVNEAGMIIVGKTNMDEFAMGSTSQTSYFGAPKNPWDKTRISGGSSGGSASVVAGLLAPIALGSDTGGSIRQPASYCGIVGMKPTYGRISRRGLIAFGSSLDQIGPMTKNVYDNALVLNSLVGYDEFDLTSSNREAEDFTRLIGEDIKGMKIAIPNYFISDIVDSEIKENVLSVCELLKENGATVDFIDIKHLEHAVTLYQIIAMGEASSNLARFDGVRFGYSADSNNVDELYAKTRAEGFGSEVKRRIMVGSYLLSGDNAKEYYTKALQVRNSMKESFDEAFKNYDLIIGPTTTTVAYHLGEGMDDARKTFLDDVLVIPVNMAGLPGLNIPIGFNHEHMPIGLHIIGNRFEEAKMYKLGSFIEKELNLDLKVKEENHE